MEKKPAGAKVFSWTLWKYDMAVAKAAADGKVSVQVRAIGCDGEV